MPWNSSLRASAEMERPNNNLILLTTIHLLITKSERSGFKRNRDHSPSIHPSPNHFSRYTPHSGAGYWFRFINFSSYRPRRISQFGREIKRRPSIDVKPPISFSAISPRSAFRSPINRVDNFPATTCRSPFSIFSQRARHGGPQFHREISVARK